MNLIEYSIDARQTTCMFNKNVMQKKSEQVIENIQLMCCLFVDLSALFTMYTPTSSANKNNALFFFSIVSSKLVVWSLSSVRLACSQKKKKKRRNRPSWRWRCRCLFYYWAFYLFLSLCVCVAGRYCFRLIAAVVNDFSLLLFTHTHTCRSFSFPLFYWQKKNEKYFILILSFFFILYHNSSFPFWHTSIKQNKKKRSSIKKRKSN